MQLTPERLPLEEVDASSTNRGHRDEAFLLHPDVRDAFEADPPWIARIGGWWLGGLLAASLAAAAFVPHSSRIVAPLTVTTDLAPVELKAGSTGILLTDLRDGTAVLPDQVVAVVADPHEFRQVQMLREYLRELDDQLATDRAPPPPPPLSTYSTGLAEAHGAVRQAVSHLDRDDLTHGALEGLEAKQAELDGLERRQALIIEQMEVAGEREELQRRELSMKRILVEKSIEPSIRLLSYERQLLEMRAERVALAAELDDVITRARVLQATIAQLRRKTSVERSQRLEEIRLAAAGLRAVLAEWDRAHLLRAPLEGTLRRYSAQDIGDHVARGEAIAVIEPRDAQFIARVTVTAGNAGRITPGQEVLVALDAYPPGQYGRLVGRVRQTSGFALNGSSLVEVEWPDDAHMSGGMRPRFTVGMPGKAEVVVNKQSLLRWLVGRLAI